MMGCDSWARRERGIWTRDRETGRRVIVTCMEWENAAIVSVNDRKKEETDCMEQVVPYIQEV
jgi:hypothetical protein